MEAALERVTDAEAGAIALLNENEELLKNAKLTVANITTLQQQLAKTKHGSIIGFALGGVFFGAGTPLTIEGVRQDNRMMTMLGVGTVGVGITAWLVGHFIFHRW